MHVIVIILMAVLILPNCAPRVSLGPVYLVYPEETPPVEIELTSFSFQPRHIAILKNDSLFIFRLKNTARIRHNFTLLDSHKNILTSVNLMPNESTMITIDSLDSGNYTFYCNRFLHRFLGMKGMLMVE